MDKNVSATQDVNSEVSREATRGGRYRRPSVDITETADELIVSADMPGNTAENVSLNYYDGTLTLQAVVADRQDNNTNYLLQEYEVVDFYREFIINEHIDSEHISGQLVDGVLTVRIPKSADKKPRKIEIAVPRN